MRELLISPYRTSHSSALRERNMILLLQVILDRSVGGERILMSIAVPRRMGTRGVNSSATMGRPLLSPLPDSEGATLIS